MAERIETLETYREKTQLRMAREYAGMTQQELLIEFKNRTGQGSLSLIIAWEKADDPRQPRWEDIRVLGEILNPLLKANKAPMKLPELPPLVMAFVERPIDEGLDSASHRSHKGR